jgi:hypothetical protein
MTTKRVDDAFEHDGERPLSLDGWFGAIWAAIEERI